MLKLLNALYSNRFTLLLKIFQHSLKIYFNKEIPRILKTSKLFIKISFKTPKTLKLMGHIIKMNYLVKIHTHTLIRTHNYE